LHDLLALALEASQDRVDEAGSARLTQLTRCIDRLGDRRMFRDFAELSWKRPISSGAAAPDRCRAACEPKPEIRTRRCQRRARSSTSA
jgi:hypothetical protein